MYYSKLDSLQLQVYQLLEQLLRLNQDESIDDIKLDQINITKKINDILLRYKDYISIIKNRIKRGDSAQHSQLELYESKLTALRVKVRSIQLQANELNNELIHEKRISKFSLDNAEVSENGALSNEDAREQLFANRSSAKKQDGDVSVNHQILSHNKQITTSLQATRQLLSTSVLQSELNIDSLDQQTKDLHKLNEEFIKFSDLLNKSKQIVKFIEKQDKSDRNRIYLSIGFFLVCCAWIIWRRILRTPVKILLWSFFKVFRIFNWLFLFGQSGTNMEISEISSISSPITSTVATAIASTITSAIELGDDIVLHGEEDDIVPVLTSIISTTTEILMDEL